MNLEIDGDVLRVSQISELRAKNSEAFKTEVLSLVCAPLSRIDVDLSDTARVDSCGLGALLALERMAARTARTDVSVRLVNPSPEVQQILELTRIYRVLEVVKP